MAPPQFEGLKPWTLRLQTNHRRSRQKQTNSERSPSCSCSHCPLFHSAFRHLRVLHFSGSNISHFLSALSSLPQAAQVVCQCWRILQGQNYFSLYSGKYSLRYRQSAIFHRHYYSHLGIPNPNYRNCLEHYPIVWFESPSLIWNPARKKDARGATQSSISYWDQDRGIFEWSPKWSRYSLGSKIEPLLRVLRNSHLLQVKTKDDIINREEKCYCEAVVDRVLEEGVDLFLSQRLFISECVKDQLQSAHVRVARKKWHPSEHLSTDAANSPYINLLVIVGVTNQKLWGTVPPRWDIICIHALWVSCPCKAEITHLETAWAADQKIFGFDISVN